MRSVENCQPHKDVVCNVSIEVGSRPLGIHYGSDQHQPRNPISALIGFLLPPTAFKQTVLCSSSPRQRKLGGTSPSMSASHRTPRRSTQAQFWVGGLVGIHMSTATSFEVIFLDFNGTSIRLYLSEEKT